MGGWGVLCLLFLLGMYSSEFIKKVMQYKEGNNKCQFCGFDVRQIKTFRHSTGRKIVSKIKPESSMHTLIPVYQMRHHL